MTKTTCFISSVLALLGRNGAEEETVIESVNEVNMMSLMLKMALSKR